MNHEIEHIIKGVGGSTEGNLIQAAISHLRASKETGGVLEESVVLTFFTSNR